MYNRMIKINFNLLQKIIIWLYVPTPNNELHFMWHMVLNGIQFDIKNWIFTIWKNDSYVVSKTY